MHGFSIEYLIKIPVHAVCSLKTELLLLLTFTMYKETNAKTFNSYFNRPPPPNFLPALFKQILLLNNNYFP